MRRRTLLIGEAVLAAGIIFAALWTFAGVARQADFYGDEGKYIARSFYFKLFFLEHNVTDPAWDDVNWVHTQPMLGNYVVGGWLWARGYDFESLPDAYKWRQSYEQNKKLGRVPDDDLLVDARTPMVGLATASIGLLYLVGRLLGGPLAGGVASLLVIASPLMHEYLLRAQSEAPMVFLILAALLLALLGVQRFPAGRLPLAWVLPLGIALGLGLQAKLTVVLSMVALLIWALALGVRSALNAPARPLPALRHGWHAARGWLGALSLGYFVFVLTNPHLYSGPVTHTLHLFLNRAEEMGRAARYFTADAVDNLIERPALVLGGSLIDGAPIGVQGLPLEAALAAVGLVLLGLEAWRTWRAGRPPSPSSLFLLTCLVYFAGVSAGLMVAWPRYYVPTYLFGILLAAVGLSTAVRQAPRLLALRRGSSASHSGARATAPALSLAQAADGSAGSTSTAP
jgi:hypothetical protein